MFQKSKRNFNSGLQTIIIHSDTTFQKTGDMNYSFSEDINVMFLKKKKRSTTINITSKHPTGLRNKEIEASVRCLCLVAATIKRFVLDNTM